MALSPQMILTAIQALGAITGGGQQQPQQPLIPPQTPVSSFQPSPTTSQVISGAAGRAPVNTLPFVALPQSGATGPLARPSTPVVPQVKGTSQQPPGTVTPPKKQGLDFKKAAQEFALEALKNLVFRQQQPLPGISAPNVQSSFQGGVVNPFTLLANRRGR